MLTAPPASLCLLQHRLPAALLARQTHHQHHSQQQQKRLLTRAAAAAAAAPPPPPPAASAAVSDEEQQQPLPHVSVLLQEVLHNLNHMPIKVYVDCTLGAGGHMAAMLAAHPELQAAVGLDVDPTAHQLAGARLAREAASRGGGQPALHLLRGNYSDVVPLLAGVPGGSLVGRVDAMLMDLGVSSMQLDTPLRGFSFSADGPLDMRLDPDAAASAEELVNCASEAELGRILREYGEEKSWRAVARRIVAARQAAAITTTRQLAAVVGQTQLRRSGGGGGGQRGRGIHPATRTFQALRIAVNDEIRRLEAALPAALSCLSPGGRLAVISFHSLEDRLVKHAFNAAAGRPTPEQEALIAGPHGAEVLEALRARALGVLVSRKPITPGEGEVAANPRARSAKLRVFEAAGGPASAAAAAAGRHKGSKARRRDGGDVSTSRDGRHNSDSRDV